MTRARFSYSEIRGSTLAWQLPAAYRSLQRPSSASSAKASTGCPLQLAETMLALAMEFSGISAGRPAPARASPSGRALRFTDQARVPAPRAEPESHAFRSLQSCTVCPTRRHLVPTGHDPRSVNRCWVVPPAGWVPKG